MTQRTPNEFSAAALRHFVAQGLNMLTSPHSDTVSLLGWQRVSCLAVGERMCEVCDVEYNKTWCLQIRTNDDRKTYRLGFNCVAKVFNPPFPWSGQRRNLLARLRHVVEDRALTPAQFRAALRTAQHERDQHAKT